jgi:UDP-glucose 4-epimerase
VRVVVLGGTHFVGRAIVEDLVTAGHEVTLIHRGLREPGGMAAVTHIHLARETWATAGATLAAIEPDAVVDCLAMCREDAAAALAAFSNAARLVVLSSMDVYRAFASLNTGRDTDAVPIDEGSPLSEDRHPRRGQGDDGGYSKQDVEEEYLGRGGVVLRLPAVYGEHDYRRREEFILRRVRARRRSVPIGTGGFLWTRGWVRDIARGVRLAVEHEDAGGEVFNIGEERSWTIRLWARRILDAAGSDIDLVEVPDDVLPADMTLSAARLTQPVLVSSAKARRVLGYTDSDPMSALRSSVGWHLRHPPEDADPDFSADDTALESRLPPRTTA